MANPQGKEYSIATEQDRDTFAAYVHQLQNDLRGSPDAYALKIGPEGKVIYEGVLTQETLDNEMKQLTKDANTLMYVRWLKENNDGNGLQKLLWNMNFRGNQLEPPFTSRFLSDTYQRNWDLFGEYFKKHDGYLMLAEQDFHKEHPDKFKTDYSYKGIEEIIAASDESINGRTKNSLTKMNAILTAAREGKVYVSIEKLKGNA